MITRGLGFWGIAAAAGAAVVLAGGCSPIIDKGQCSTDEPCPRGQSCDFEVAECSDLGLLVTATEDPAPATFSTKPIPFFRGEVCTVHEVESGTAFPVRVSPCLHPCLAASSFKFKHSWNCVGSKCDAWGVMWVDASGDSCPADAFGSFDQSQCVYSNPVEFSILPVFSDGTVIEGSMRLEIPFLSNSDAAQIAANQDTAFIQTKIDQYPENDARVVGGKDVSLLASNPTPPETCGENGENCDCFDVGF